MATGRSRIELVIELKNRLKAGLASARSQVDREVGRMRSRLAQFSASAKASFKSFASEIPFLNNGLRLLSNPIALTAGAVVGLAAGFKKVTDRAAEFNHNFRDLANLNLTKTRAELNELRTLVLDTAWKKGFGADETSQAYNDIQSTIGLYGKDARAIVEEQGEFAKLMKADMNQWIAGTAKAMANWRFGNERLADFNKSAYATMQVGVISFEELARLQSVYAGTAASAKQDFDTANKMLSLFTVKTKNANIAATQTASLFADLTKKTTIDAFKKIGINFYDSAGKIKQADKIMLELNDKFLKLKNDKSIITLKNKFTGSQGLIAMINAATDASGELRNMLNEFTDSKFNMDNAVTEAQKDIVYRQEQLSKRIDLLVIKLGQKFLGLKEGQIGWAERTVEDLHYATNSTEDNQREKKAAGTEKAKKDVADFLVGVDTISDAIFEERKKLLWQKIDIFGESLERENSKSKENQTLFGFKPLLENEDTKNEYDWHHRFARFELMGYVTEAKRTLLKLEEMRSNFKKYGDVSGDPTKKTTTTTTTTDPLYGNSINKITGSAKQIRNITVNIDAFNKGSINTQNTGLQKMDEKQIEEWFTDMCMRVVRNVETSY